MDNSNILNQIVNHMISNIIKKLNTCNSVSEYKNSDYDLTNDEIIDIAGKFIFVKYFNELKHLILINRNVCAISEKDDFLCISIYSKKLK